VSSGPSETAVILKAVRRAFASSLLALLLVTTLIGGGCISCEQYFMWPGAKTCCAPDGHCKTKTAPVKAGTERECKQIAFDHQKLISLHVELPVIAAVWIAPPAPMMERFPGWQGTKPIEPSPPDLQVLHSTFLI
jgi:hypothetical protein